MPAPLSVVSGWLCVQVLEGKSRRGQRISLSIQFNPFDRKWELFDESSTEDRHQLVMELLERGYVAKYEDLKDILGRSASSAERYIKQAVEIGCFSEKEWKEWRYRAKSGSFSRDERKERGKQLVEQKSHVLSNEPG